ncbi:tRNA (adenosine(37)-N6)-threonylcarbamoyltransferase complex ATPase subunit type 1 TsaE [Bailinhaonella thermotolerans]|uniref:tRNA threonylcarbamoyladenosine biosynthesis protein TsaE n=1 Tax=Bailinhaonella thermotolerans TaxID=1070861 RepID=A0A3A4A4X7_9ACTN|nr:tRNA (adenosine(37)-N6)-threonylcarbamoyltransferase complex ATPase subunit type 1 TsaE [Bailinhaonella thermotolerans]RJL23565.1 tRNA (adenosine(37)-N6)-threonylcarbamoyltransferase complex ATPase subunit type 1 TsaE [Bailinhaonella thermotolerans]
MSPGHGEARVFRVPTVADMQDLGRRVGEAARAGDLLVLSGSLGAGKTTFTQGLAEGLKVRGPITSPTFVIARVHPSLRGGPALVHVDAYRLGGDVEVDDLDLDASLEESVTVVEWGSGLVEGLSEERLEIEISRAGGGEGGDGAEGGDGPGGDDVREVRMTPVGPRWTPLPF